MAAPTRKKMTARNARLMTRKKRPRPKRRRKLRVDSRRTMRAKM